MSGYADASTAAGSPGLAGAGEALRLVSVRKVFGGGDNAVTALDGVSLSLRSGTFTAVMGPSGSGKSTLLQTAAGLDEPTAGQVFVDGAEMAMGSEAELTKFRPPPAVGPLHDARRCGSSASCSSMLWHDPHAACRTMTSMPLRDRGPEGPWPTASPAGVGGGGSDEERARPDSAIDHSLAAGGDMAGLRRNGYLDVGEINTKVILDLE